jgi:hypothetical protein
VTHRIDDDLDLSTFALRSFNFGNLSIAIPGGVQQYQTRVDYQNADGSPLVVEFTASLDVLGRVATWTFRSFDPVTGTFPADPLAGFLPPENGTGVGQGFVAYTILPAAGLPTGTTIDQQASIVFDTNAAIVTNRYTNTIDRGAPRSQIAELDATLATETIHLQWDGQDDADGLPGSGIAAYDIFVSMDDGPWQVVVRGTTSKMIDYQGTLGHRYAFYSQAVDNVGLLELPPLVPDAVTRLVSPDVRAGDLDGDDDVDLVDLLGLLGGWTGSLEPGTGGRSPADGDMDGDEDVDSADLLALLGEWTGAENVSGARLPGDTDRDTDVDAVDLLSLLANWTGTLEPGTGAMTADEGDTDQDQDVDSGDLLTTMSSWTGAAARRHN